MSFVKDEPEPVVLRIGHVTSHANSSTTVNDGEKEFSPGFDNIVIFDNIESFSENKPQVTPEFPDVIDALAHEIMKKHGIDGDQFADMMDVAEIMDDCDWFDP
jgi:hypothetical protein